MPIILIIDDEKELCAILEDLFSSEGFRVLTAHDGDQGVRIARAQHPDVILSDIRMPGINGHEAVIEFRKIPALTATPIILFTANADLEDMRKGMDAGADDYLSKPVELDDILKTVNKHLGRSAARREETRKELVAQRANTGAMLPIDLVDPLHEIIGCASVLQSDAKLMTEVEISEFSRNIIHGAETLNQRFENFILFSRIQSGALVINPPRMVDLSELVTTTAQQVAGRHHRINTLRLDIEASTAAVSVELLSKALGEIIDNACRYSLSSEPIDVALHATETAFEIIIQDYGMGIGQDQLERLESETITRGCGMLLSRKLTEAMNGSWDLGNRPKHGAKITLRFPFPQSE
ncbi:MAG: response regulator [Opitutaceae bacterium]|nr:response regulator [Opitutaceae bacterium]